MSPLIFGQYWGDQGANNLKSAPNFISSVEHRHPYDMKIPDSIKGADYFTTIPIEDNKNFWHHREMVRYKYGKTKKLTEALEFLDSKYKELHSLVEPLEKDIK